MHRKWGSSSKAQLQTCTMDVRWLLTMVLLEVADISVIEGHRDEERQNSLYPTYTKLRWPDGKHNRYPSQAVDIQPYPRPDTDRKLISALSYIAGAAVQIGKRRGLIIRWGGDWDCDGDLTDQSFDDLFHIEVKRGPNYIPLPDTDYDLLRSMGLAGPGDRGR